MTRPAGTTELVIHVVNRRKGGVLRWIPRLFFLLVLSGSVGAAGVAVGAYVHFSRGLPPVPATEDWRPPVVTRLYGHDGRLVGELSTERRALLPLARIPRRVIEAFLAAEDSRFFAHDGVDWRATLRALRANWLAGRTVSGASTLTQQLAKPLVGREKSYARKAREAILARRMDRQLGKLEVLRRYLNTIYLGHGAYGVQAAAESYFRKSIGELDLAEIALLAGLPPQPGRLNPVLDLEGSKRRQRYVLDRMVAEGFVTSAEADAAAARPLAVFTTPPAVAEEETPYFTEHVRRQLQADYGTERLYGDGLQVWLSVDADLQRAAQAALGAGLQRLGRRQGYTGPLRRLAPGEVAGFRAAAARHYAGLAAPAPDAEYVALVTAAERGAATVQVGPVEARLPLAGMKWAVPWDAAAERNGGRVAAVSDVLAPGDVVLVRGTEAGEVALSQEPPVQGALVSLDPHTGGVVAMVGGYDFDQSEYNRAFQGCRQPGSVFKPVVYSLALARDYTLATPLSDTPMSVYDPAHELLWKPRNMSGKFAGEVLLIDALVRSMNLPAIRTIEHVGPAQAAKWAAHLGITTPMYPDRSLVLGSSCVYPWELALVYATFARRGRAPRPVFVKRVLDRDGNVLEDRTHFTDAWAPVAARLDGMLRAFAEPAPRKLDEETGFLMQTALERVVRAGTAADARALGHPAGGKTGTTDAHDAWFVGFTRSLVTAVWVGSDLNDRKLGRGETGGRVALPVWLAYMGAALEGVPPASFTEDPPAGIRFVDVDRRSGLLAPRGNRALHLPFRSGTEPTEQARRMGQGFDDRDLDLIEGRF